MWLIIELAIVAIVLFISKLLWDVLFYLFCIFVVLMTVSIHYGWFVSFY